MFRDPEERMEMLRWSLMGMDGIRDEDIRGTVHVRRCGEKVREARLRYRGGMENICRGWSQTEEDDGLW